MEWICGDEQLRPHKNKQFEQSHAVDYTRSPKFLKPKQAAIESRSIQNQTKILSVNYHQILAELRQKRHQFIDTSFPEQDSQYSMISLTKIYRNMELLPSKLTPEQILTHAADSYNANLLCTIANLASQNRLQSIFPIKTVNEEGLYVVVMYINELQQMVIVDDKVPVSKSKHQSHYPQNILYTKAYNYLGKQFIYPIIIEKALAKIVGGYNKMDQDEDYLHYFTCGIIETRLLYSDYHIQQIIWKRIIQTIQSKGIVFAKTKFDNDITKYGINKSQTYKLICAQQIFNGMDTVKLVGFIYGGSWKGPYCVMDPIWKSITEQDKFRIKFDGICHNRFYMQYKDFLNFFLEIKFADCTQHVNYCFENKNEPAQPMFLRISLKGKSSNLTLKFQSKSKQLKQPAISNIIVAEIRQGLIKYITGYNSNENQFLVRIPQLQPQEYILSVDVINSDLYQLIISAPEPIDVCQITPIERFIETTVIEHNPHQANYITIGQNSKSYIAQKIYLHSCGYAYLQFCVDKDSIEELLVVINLEIIRESGLILVSPNITTTQQRVLKAGQRLILLLKMNSIKNMVMFPPNLVISKLK